MKKVEIKKEGFFDDPNECNHKEDIPDVTNILVCKSNSVGFQKLLIEYAEAIGCEVIVNRQIIREIE